MIEIMSTSIQMDDNTNQNMKIIRISQPLVIVRIKPSLRYGTICCELHRGVYLEYLEETSEFNKKWIRVNLGWICAKDNNDNDNYEFINDIKIAIDSWKLEETKRKRFSSAIVSSIIKFYSLPKAKRFIRSIVKHSDKFYPEKPMIHIEKKGGLEDIMLILNGRKPKTKEEVFEFIKSAASEQSNPSQSVVDIVKEIETLINTRPSTWVMENMNVLVTENVLIRNDQFIMSAASGDIELFCGFLSIGQEMIALHSELCYTALHAAADFGRYEIIDIIIQRGYSLDMQDPKLMQTALHYASWSGRIEVIKRLLSAGDPIYSRKREIIGYIGGADRKIRNRDGLRPYECANIQGHLECRDHLKAFPPPVIDIEIADVSISTITIVWKPPVLNMNIHSEVVKYYIECYPVDKSLPTDYISEKYNQADRLTCIFTNLLPSSTYEIRIKTYTLAGFSPFSKSIYQLTLSYVPDAPDPVEICKISTNGFLLQWHPPFRDNGKKVDYYQIEIIDAKNAIDNCDQSDEINDDNNHITNEINVDIVNPINNNQEIKNSKSLSPSSKEKNLPKKLIHSTLQHNIKEKTIPVPTITNLTDPESIEIAKHRKFRRLKIQEMQGGISKFHRLVQHKNIHDLLKYFTGLEPYRYYQCRIRAHNELGYSPWSGWCGPVSPQPGVTIAEYIPEKLSATLTWFQPLLSCNRTVEAYEFQLCCLRGPIMKSISLLSSKMQNNNNNNDNNNSNSIKKHIPKYVNDDDTSNSYELFDEELYMNHNKIKEDDENNEYITITNTIQENIYTLQDLKAGNRYKVRVRCKVKEYLEWSPWEHGLLSDVFMMPATPPEPPFQVKVALKKQILSNLLPNSSLLILNQTSSDSMISNNNNNSNATNSSSNIDASLSIDNMMDPYKTGEFIPIDYINTTKISSLQIMKEKNELNKSYDSEESVDSSNDIIENSTILNPNTNIDILNSNNHDNPLNNNNEQNQSLDVLITKNSIIERKDNDIDMFVEDTIKNERQLYDIMHDRITITWENGQSNGRPIEEFIIQIAKINIFNIQDVLYAQDAYHFNDIDDSYTISSMIDDHISNHPSIPKDIEWYDIIQLNNMKTQDNPSQISANDYMNQYIGMFHGANNFIIMNLYPGNTYIFRLKHRNDCGWSCYSTPSRMISTYPTIPPNPPMIVLIKNTYVLAKWIDKKQIRLELTNLLYQVQLGIIPPQRINYNDNTNHNEDINDNIDEVDKLTDMINVKWRTIKVKHFYGNDEILGSLYKDHDHLLTTMIQHNNDYHDEIDIMNSSNMISNITKQNSNNNQISQDENELKVNHVLIPNLISGVTYVLRCRVRTIIGWSPWSESSKPFRMML